MDTITNMRNMVTRIASEADTVEDMKRLLLSEIRAYEDFTEEHEEPILYAEAEVDDDNGVVYVGRGRSYRLKLIQSVEGDRLITKYEFSFPSR